jgi:hypothetical protein
MSRNVTLRRALLGGGEGHAPQRSVLGALHDHGQPTSQNVTLQRWRIADGQQQTSHFQNAFPEHRCTDARKTRKNCHFMPHSGTPGVACMRPISLRKTLQHQQFGRIDISASPSKVRVAGGPPKTATFVPSLVHSIDLDSPALIPEARGVQCYPRLMQSWS